MKDTEAAEIEYNDKFRREYSNRINTRNFEARYSRNSDFSSQYNYKQICTCRKAKCKQNKFYNSSNQVYRTQNKYLYSKVVTDIGVGSVKSLPKKRVTRIYLPQVKDTGVGSTEILVTLQPRNKILKSGYYEQKRTSSKCVGGFMVYIDVSVHDKDLSAIVQTQSDSTSPLVESEEKYINSGSYTVEKHPLNIEDVTVLDVVNEKLVKDKIKPGSPEIIFEKSVSTLKESDRRSDKKSIFVSSWNKDTFSSDSLVQHVYNLENPSADKYSKTSQDPMENKLEREYRKIFSMKPKQKKATDETQISDLKSASTLRRRFEALRQGFGRKKDLKNDSIVIKVSSVTTVPSKKDVSIVSDPPSLESRSFSKPKLYSPKISNLEPRMAMDSPIFHKKSFNISKENSIWSTDIETEFQSAKGMFKLWGKKFDLEDDVKKPEFPKENIVKISSVEKNFKGRRKEVLQKDVIGKTKKEGKMFSFFKKKSKCNDKPKQSYKAKKNVTAGRCEVGDGFMIKIETVKKCPIDTPMPSVGRQIDDYDDILRKTWLKKFLTSKIELKKSAQIRWNNKLYGTSSSTIFELIDCIYKNTDIVLTSKSEVNTRDSSSYYISKPKVNFMQQDIKAWMVPKTILDRENNNFKNIQNSQLQTKNIEVTFSNRKWLIDKSKAFSQNIEIVLHSNNIVRQKKKSSQYITINIPQGYFSESDRGNMDCNNHTSDEEVFKIVEYETPTSNSYFKPKRERSMDTGDHNSLSNNIKVTVSIKDSKHVESKVLETIIKRPPLHRDVIVQGSKVYFPKRCDVIGVGIITQKDMRRIKKPILKIQDYLSDEDSEPITTSQKKCEFAESYLQDYYRNWTPLGFDLFSWCVSDSQLRGSSENNSLQSLNNQGDGSKSCPNIYDDYQAATLVSSCNTSSCSQCWILEKERKKGRALGRRITRDKDESENEVTITNGTRVLPKDSLEVFKRRQLYACSNKSKWSENYVNPCCDDAQPYSVPSVEDKCSQNTSDVGLKSFGPCYKILRKRGHKRVLLPDSCTMDNLLAEQLGDKCVEGILSYKGGRKDTKRTQMTSQPPLEICHPLDKKPCIKKDKKSTETCDDENLPCHCGNEQQLSPSGSVLSCDNDPCRSSQATQLTPPRSTVNTFTNTLPDIEHTSHRVLQQFSQSFQQFEQGCSLPKPDSCASIRSPSLYSCTTTPLPSQTPQSSIEPTHDKTPCVNRSEHSPSPSSLPTPPKCLSPSQCRPSSPRRERSSRAKAFITTCESPPQRSSPSKCYSRSPQYRTPSPQRDCCSSQRECSTRHNIQPCNSPPMHSHVPVTSNSPPRCGTPSTRRKSPPYPRCCGPRLEKKPEHPLCCTRKPQHKSLPRCAPPSQPSPSPSPPRVSPSRSPSRPSPSRSPSRPSPSRSLSRPSPSRSPSRPSPSRSPSQPPPFTEVPDPCLRISSDSDCTLNSCPYLKPSNKGNPCKKSCTSSSKSSKSDHIETNTQGCSPDCSFNKILNPFNDDVSSRQKNSFSTRPRDYKGPRKQAGVHLKKLPRTHSPTNSSKGLGIIRLNSNEHLLIKLRPGSPSTDEIRGKYNIKVQDDDGTTVYERRDYKRNMTQLPNLVQNLYRDSRVHRISTSNIANDVICEKKSSKRYNTSLSNIVEINLTLKLKHDDNNGTVVTNNCGDNPVEVENTNMHLEPPTEIFALQNHKTHKSKPSHSKDLNIKITINNYKEHDVVTSNDCISPLLDKEFSDKITEKFRSVSTGSQHSFTVSEGVLGQQAFSIHQTTVDLNNSKDKQINEFASDAQSMHKVSLTNVVLPGVAVSDKEEEYVSEQEQDQRLLLSDMKQKVSSNQLEISEQKAVVIKTDSYTKETPKLETFRATEDVVDIYCKSDVEKPSKGKEFPVSILKTYSKEKKEILKNIFETERKLSRHNKKEKLKVLRQMLTAILSSDSSEDNNLSNQLADEVTYASLKPNYFRDTDSMNNYCHLDSLSENQLNVSNTEEQIYPTEEDNTSESNDEKPKGGCFCSQIAAKLNMCEITNAACSCKHGQAKKNEETNCDLKDEYFLNYSKYVDVETQDSTLGKLKSVLVTNMSTTITVEELKENKECAKSCRRRCPHNKKRHRISNEMVNIFKKDSNIDKYKNMDRLRQRLKPEDNLQLNETKKAVLEIYAEKTISTTGQRVVARLPKFVTNRESEMRGFQEALAGFKRLNTEASGSLPVAR